MKLPRLLLPLVLAGMGASGCVEETFQFMGPPGDRISNGLFFLAGGLAEAGVHTGAHLAAAEYSHVDYSVRGDRGVFLREDLNLDNVSDAKFLNVVRAGLVADHVSSETIFWVDPAKRSPFLQGMQAGSIFFRSKIALENGVDIGSITESSGRVSNDALRGILLGGAMADVARWTFPDSNWALALSWAGRGAFLFSVELPF